MLMPAAESKLFVRKIMREVPPARSRHAAIIEKSEMPT